LAVAKPGVLEYEAYTSMAEAVLEQIAREARTRWNIGGIAVHHRIGRLEIGETAVLVVVAAPHRREAFEAAAWIMDRIKEIAPIWKKEYWADGAAEWVGDERNVSANCRINVQLRNPICPYSMVNARLLASPQPQQISARLVCTHPSLSEAHLSHSYVFRTRIHQPAQ
jgi:Molybdopterin converting factor, large subunit